MTASSPTLASTLSPSPTSDSAQRCAAWTQFPPGKPPACYLFAAVNGTRPTRTKDIGERGHRKEEAQAHHLGAIVKGGNGQWPQHLRWQPWARCPDR